MQLGAFSKLGWDNLSILVVLNWGGIFNVEVHVQEGKRSYLITPPDPPNRPSKSGSVKICTAELQRSLCSCRGAISLQSKTSCVRTGNDCGFFHQFVFNQLEPEAMSKSHQLLSPYSPLHLSLFGILHDTPETSNHQSLYCSGWSFQVWWNLQIFFHLHNSPKRHAVP